MIIDKIVLYNFGSYEGENIFDTRGTDGRSIVLIGGKNGAGKTTLFAAMRICLYGYMSMGYKNQNSFYYRAITKLINNEAKMIRPAKAHVQMTIEINNGRGVDTYDLLREWTLTDSLSEAFCVLKNGSILNDEETADFEKYLLSVIPPELFNLYFFDGEKIAEFFLEEGSNARIKSAFLTLCGYDTFDIMRKNFRRISTGKSKSSPALDEYIAAKDSASEAKERYLALTELLKNCLGEIDSCEAEIAALEKEYYQKGGISQEEWDNKIFALKDEERKRENWNALLKKWATELIPFLMVRDQIVALKGQIDSENKGQKYINFCEVINSPEIAAIVGAQADELQRIAFQQYGEKSEPILSLSVEQSAILLGQINRILEFDVDKVGKCRRAIKHSVALTAKLRQELDNSSVSSVQEYMQKRAQLFEKKSLLLVQRVELEQKVADQQNVVLQADATLARIQTRLEADLKKASITDISAKSIIMLDKLQQVLFQRQIEKVEAFFRIEISTLMRKIHFIDDMRIDDSFNTHLYRRETFSANRIVEILTTNSEEHVTAMLGDVAIKELQDFSGAEKLDEIAALFIEQDTETVDLLVEIDKATLSNGEKQIFIMALYHSLVQLCNHEIPFIIDTPFARIDTEHRRNISEYFFRQLNGQVFILSTNEEISSEHVQIMEDKIAATYLLENTDNKRTTVVSGKYFEV